MKLRPAVPGDAMAVARVHVRAWQAAYRGMMPDGYLAGLRPEDRAQRYRFASEDVRDPATVVAIEDETICGFATTGPARDPDVANSTTTGTALTTTFSQRGFSNVQNRRGRRVVVV